MPLLDGAPEAAPATLARRPDWPGFTEPWPPPIERRPDPPAPSNVIGMDTFLAAKTERERAEAEMAKDELARKRGQLTDAEDARRVFRECGKMYARVREQVPGDVATQLVGKTDPWEIEQIIRTAIREADTRIADEIAAKFTEVLGHVRSGSIAG